MQKAQRPLLLKLTQKGHCHHLLVPPTCPSHLHEDAFLASQNSLQSTDPL